LLQKFLRIQKTPDVDDATSYFNENFWNCSTKITFPWFKLEINRIKRWRDMIIISSKRQMVTHKGKSRIFFEGPKKVKNFWNLLPTRFFKKVAFFGEKLTFWRKSRIFLKVKKSENFLEPSSYEIFLESCLFLAKS